MTKTPTTKKTRKVTSIPELPINPFVFEVFEAASKQRTAVKKVEVLKKYEHDSVKAMAIWNFDKTVISLLPEGPVPYGETNAQTTFAGTLSDNLAREAQGGESATGQDLDGRNKTSIRNEYVNFYNFIKGGNPSLTTTRREMMFINMLQGLHPKEAELLILVKDKKLTDKYKITQDQVAKAYPDITWGGRS
tara:strand:+ start:299 stop:871 length:573 start_codon:yes stop_codon:yes gene_type:complete